MKLLNNDQNERDFLRFFGECLKNVRIDRPKQ